MKWQVAPREWHSEYRPAHRDTWQFVEGTVGSAERYLRPLYLTHLSQGADRVAGLFRDADIFIRRWGISRDVLVQPVVGDRLVPEFIQEFQLAEAPGDWNEHLVSYFNAVRLAEANGFPGRRLLTHRRDAVNTRCYDIALGSQHYQAIPADLRNAGIFVAYVEDFLVAQDELPELALKIERLKGA